MKRKAKKGNTGMGCLVLLGLAAAGLFSLFSPPRAAQQPGTATTEIVQGLAPAAKTPVALPTVTAVPTETSTPLPSATPVPLPTDTLVPVPIDTPAPLPTEPPAVAVVESGGGSDQPFVCNGGCTEPPAGSDCTIKGNVNSKGDQIYHVPGWRDYERTNVKPEEGDRWFCTEAEAQAAGFRAPLNH